MALRHPTVVVAGVHDDQKRFLVCFNERWRGYAFPMRKPRRGEMLADVARQAFADHFRRPLPGDAEVKPLEFVGAYGRSLGVEQETYFDYHVFEVKPHLDLPEGSLASWSGFLAYDDLMQAEKVTWSTQQIARALVEFQEVVLAVISRQVESKDGGLETEFLMTRKASYQGYFFPVVRLKSNAKPEQVAMDAVEADTGYSGRIETTQHQEVEHEQHSPRYDRRRRFRFHVCKVELPGVDLPVSRNPLEDALLAVAAEVGDAEYWGWFNEEQLKDPKIMSPTVETVRLAAIATAEK